MSAMELFRGQHSIGMQNWLPEEQTLPPYGEDPQAIIDYLLTQVANLRTLVEGKADAGKLKTLIQFSDEAIRIQAENIAMVGAVTFLDVWRDQTGAVTGGVHPSLTRIRGGVIQTEQIISGNWSTLAGSAFDLDNGTFYLGGSASPKLSWNGTTLAVVGNGSFTGTLTAGSIITDSVTVNGVTIGTIASNAAAGSALNTALTVSGTTILRGIIQPDNTGAIAIGTITWNSSTGALTGGTGIALTEWGLIGASSGVATFSIDTATGSPIFAGALQAATGTFVGSLSAATGTFSGDISAASGTFTGALITSGQVTITGQHTSGGQVAALHVVPSGGGLAIYANSGSSTSPTIQIDHTGGAGIGLLCQASSTGIFASANGSGGVAIQCAVAGSATVALRIQAGTLEIGSNLITKSRVTGQVIHVYTPGGAEIAGSPFEFAFA
jgi:hypothetical protein